MNVTSNKVYEFLEQLKLYFLGDNIHQRYGVEEPLRSELLSSDQMEQHSKALAKSQILSKKQSRDRLLIRLADNEKVLLEVRNLLNQTVQENDMITPAGEWLLDNFYLIEEQIRTAKKHLPKGYSEVLPQLSNGPSSGLPRVYDIALNIISHSDGHIDKESLNNFVKAYQTVAYFQLGELWAVPIMLRLALIENLRRVSARIAIDRINRNLADYWSREIINTVENDPKSLILVIADMARSNPPLERAFVAEFSRQLSGKGPILAQPLNWVEERLAEIGQSSIELVQAENQKQAADQVSVSNTIGSLRLLGSMDWKEFVESNSIIEQKLKEDSIYMRMDFTTRDHYRHVVEHIAKQAEIPEQDVADAALALAREHAEKYGAGHRFAHVGYFLIGDGLTQLEERTKMRLPFAEAVRRKFAGIPFTVYVGSIFLITLSLSAAIVYKVYLDEQNRLMEIIVGILSLICTSQLAVTLVNFAATILVRPGLLPRLDFSEGIPEDSSTLVVVPTLLTSLNDIENLVEALEVRYLANKNEHLYFGLLTDFTDSAEQDTPEDEPLLQLVKHRVEELNEKYDRKKSDLFYLFHRARKWNPTDKVWMGYERKRGKLADLNSLLRGNSKDAFSVIVGDQELLLKIKYVLTLDSDTQLPREAAWKIVGSMAHPLNRAFYDENKQRVTEGYGILQPRVSISLPDLGSSLYALMNGNEPGIDPYTLATSDVYQDLFGEGSFIGKGIYEVDIFEKAVGHRFPENRILSHDLLEGCYARSGLISDVQLYEKYPVRYNSDMKRRHRWIRGDWQIVDWFLPFVPGGDQRWHINPLSAISRWKIFDNIRRSLVPFALILFALLSWTLLRAAATWTLIVTFIVILPIIVSSMWDLLRKPKDLILSHHLLLSSRSAGSGAIRTLFSMICLPYEAYVSMDAIVRIIWRLTFSRKNLLEWNPADHSKGKSDNDLFRSYRTMWPEPTIGLAVFVYLLLAGHHHTLIVAGPIIFLWLGAPSITWWVSRGLPRQVAKLTKEDTVFLRKLSRKTWSFFEEFVNAGENWLPPDNFQEIPVATIATRTSPTNIGFSLVANLAANEFGYITGKESIERTANTFDTLSKLERYKGHFYNWYDTQSLQPLWPRYISTVDSGNLAGLLLTLKQGYLQMPNKAIISINWLEGISETFQVLSESLEKKDIQLLGRFKDSLDKWLNDRPAAPQAIYNCLIELGEQYASVENDIIVDTDSSAFSWKELMARQIKKQLDELTMVLPWLLLPPPPAKFARLDIFNHIPTLKELSWLDISLEAEFEKQTANDNTEAENEWLAQFKGLTAEAVKEAHKRMAAIENISQRCTELADIEYDFLYNKTKQLLTIGYNAEEHRTDASFYDLLASEARLSTFVGISQGKLPQESWFALSRLLTNAGGRPILLSWSGSMFEYLMPLLVMPSYENTLLDQTEKAAVRRQMEYGHQRDVPWGISESGYNQVDAALNYQYRAFGVPGLGLKRGLGEDLVIAPYASMMALMVLPEQACENLMVMEKLGFEGKYGFYEAIDYTPSRLQRGQTNAIVRSYMAHHQGMGFLSLAYLLLNKPMQTFFEAEPQFQASLLLLQERIPKATSFFAHTTNISDNISSTNEPEIRVINTPNTQVPEVQLLSNGKYHVMVTNSGASYSRWRNIAINRWREDGTCDKWGTFCYVRDIEDGTFWSNTHQPTRQKLQNYEAAFSQGRADFRSLFNKIESHTEMAVSPEDDIEIRRVNVTNRSGRRRVIDITSYTEVVITPPAADASHPAFSNLFVETEIQAKRNAILCTRRPRSTDEKPPWMFHLVNIYGKAADEVSYETDRLAFIGRGNSVADPKVMKDKGPLSGGEGSVLDPIVAIRHTVTLEPDETVMLDMILGIGESREICQSLVDKYQDKHHRDRVFELAWTHNQVVLRQINATASEAQLYTRLAGSVIFMNPAFRAEAATLAKNQRGQPGLWPYSISGDLPIVLLKIEEHTDIDVVKQMIQAHTFWRLKGLPVDLLILNDSRDTYRQVLQTQISDLLASQINEQQGAIFVRGSEQISSEDRILFHTVARIIISSQGGSLADHINRKPATKVNMPPLVGVESEDIYESSLTLPGGLQFFNGIGGFSPDGQEYIIWIADGKRTPAPWVNVIANPDFGTVVSESGQCYTWGENAHEMRLSPWENDPISDQGGETFYLRDEETGHFWSPTPLPSGDSSPYLIRHGFGYSVFEHEETGVHSEMNVYVDKEAPIKFTSIKLKNYSNETRKISATGYIEWVLGELRPKSAMYISTELDPETGTLFARNPYNTEFPGRIAFLDATGGAKTFTGDRNEFIGRNGTLKNPAAMTRVKLSGRVGAGYDPCAAIQVTIEIPAGQEKEIIFKTGYGRNMGEATNVLRQFRLNASVHESLEKVKFYWKNTLNALKVETPDASINLLANGWLTYQTLACRLWARSGYYQSGGAFGFRDQLQDVISLLISAPELARKQILLSASRQFKEGDAQHWWHPPVGRGVRTTCSDDYLWLPFATCRYVDQTGDTDILNEQVRFLEGRLLNPGEESYYDLVAQSEERATLYEHCVRSIKHGLNFGIHGLPLIGSGDWNDGMDRVGRHGKGESVWLAFFLYDILINFVPIAKLQNDESFASQCANEAQKLRDNINKNSWDGNWYRRAYFDDGTPLGSVSNDECKIDSISQSWAVLSGGGDSHRAAIAMESAFEDLVGKTSGIIRLLDPPFDKSALDPGYIKGYAPGVRENGGQYTHAAVWMIMAFAKLGNNQLTWELLKMINPIHHAKTAADIAVYKVEPYVLAGDVYGVAPHIGRGGWTWYTGSAGWMNQFITSSFLGIKQQGNTLSFKPCVPADWSFYKVRFRYKSTFYQVTFNRVTGVQQTSIIVDGTKIENGIVSLVDDGVLHMVEVTLV